MATDRITCLAPVQEPEGELRRLLTLYRQGLREPLHFFPETALAWCGPRRSSGTAGRKQSGWAATNSGPAKARTLPTSLPCAVASRWTSASASWRRPGLPPLLAAREAVRCSPSIPCTIPLAGRQLIEASAGTGKTYSLALLYLRLILEQGLEVEQILVVTFTNAATEELRGRIRARLREALDLLEGSTAARREGDLLAGLLARCQTTEEARRRLADTLTRMDEAAIYTIHGFCQRMLQDQAFEAGTPFAVEFIESEQLLRREIVEDFWRQRFYPASAEEAEWATASWQDPDGLRQVLQGFLARPEVVYVPASNRQGDSRICGSGPKAAGRGYGRCGCGHREEMAAILRDDPCLSRDKRKGLWRGVPRQDHRGDGAAGGQGGTWPGCCPKGSSCWLLR